MKHLATLFCPSGVTQPLRHSFGGGARGLCVIILLLFALLHTTHITAQSVGINNSTPDPTAALDIVSNSKGVLVPRVTSVQRVAIGSGTPATGLLVYDTDVNSFFFFNGTAWSDLSAGGAADTDWTETADAVSTTRKVGIGTSTPNEEIEVVTNSVNEGAGLRLASFGQDHFIRMFSGRDVFPAPTMWWKHGDQFLLGRSDVDDSNYQPFLGLDGKTIHVYGTEGSVYIGESAGQSDTLVSGGMPHNNVGIGHEALMMNQGGACLTAVGHGALKNNNNSHGWNTAIGFEALGVGITGQANVAVGDKALRNNEGSWNVALGGWAMRVNEDGDYNTAVGESCMELNIDGSSNTALGYNALRKHTTGNNNTSIGVRSMEDNQQGEGNVVVGHNAMNDNIDGSNNTIIGKSAGYDGSSYSGNVFIGNRAGYSENQSNRLYIANTDTSSPLIYGEFDSDLLRINGNLHVVDNTNSDAVLQLAGNTNDPDAHWTIRRDASLSGSLVWAHGLAQRLSMDISGNVLIGSTPGTTSYKLEVNGTAGKPGGGSWANTSDRRLKQNINTYSEGLNEILQIKPVTFQYNEKSGYNTKPEYVGVVAQELQEVAPYMVSENNLGYLNVDNSAMTYMLVNAVKELNEKNEALSQLVHTQQKQIEQLFSKLDTPASLKAITSNENQGMKRGLISGSETGGNYLNEK